MTRDHRCTRRELLGSSLAVTAVVLATPRLASAGHGASDPASASDCAPASDCASASNSIPASAELLGLAPGLRLGRWTVLRVRSLARSIALLVRGPEGEPYQLDVLARDPRCPGVADTRHYGVYLVNGGDGSTRSDEQRARGALAVGHYLRWAEEHLGPGPELLTMTERLGRDPDGTYRLT